MTRKTEINLCARKLILDKGYESFRLDDVLTEMELSKGGFYHYYKSVESLLEALIREDFIRDMERVEEACANPSVKQGLLQLIRSGSILEDAESGILQALNSDKSLQRYLTLMESAWYQPFKERFSAFLQKGVESGELPGVDVFAVCELFEAVNRHANRSHILGLWDRQSSERFHQAGLKLLSIELKMEQEIRQLLNGSKL